MRPTRTHALLPLLLAALASALIASGCRSTFEPSAGQRRASFARQERAFSGDTVRAVLQTYLVIAGGPGARIPSVEGSTGNLRLPLAPAGTYSQGLGIGIDEGGYLLTARHVLRETLFVVGWIDGRFTVRRARAVALGATADPRADFAVIRIDGRLDYVARTERAPEPGEPVFAVVCNRPGLGVGGHLDLAGGTVLGGGRGPAGTDPVIRTDLPLWYGDSGGPLLSADGGLIGVNAALEFTWRSGVYFERLSYHPPEGLLRRIIAADRADAAAARAAR